MASRSHFYVDTPRDPKQRHSMFVTHSDLVQTPDLSSNSSSATLPSAAGSVDRLTGLEEKKSSRFFTLKPKSSFSLRPFFNSTSSLISLSPGRRRKASKLERRDSYVQTEESRPEFGEVGVQTLNASTVDVPVQTCLEAWEEGDRFGHKRLTYASARASPFWNRPAVSSSALSNSLLPKNVPKDPLASPKLIKYAAPGDSESTALLHQSTIPSVDVNSCQPVSPSSHSISPSSSSVPVKYFSTKELSGNAISLSVNPDFPSCSKAVSEPLSELRENSNRVPLNSDTSVKDTEKNICESEAQTSQEPAILDNQTCKVSNDLKLSVLSNIDHPLSALKAERTDSPSRKLKTVHFELSEPESSQNLKKDPLKPRDIDKDFEALLKDLNILTDDESYRGCSLKIDSHEKKTPSNLISPDLKSVLDSLREDFLTPIPENSNECNEIEPKFEPELYHSNDVNKANKTQKDVVTVADDYNPVASKIVRKPFDSECKNETSAEINNDLVAPTPPSLFTSANSGSNPETDSLEGNVYDNVIKEENSVKTVLLPILPSFFEPSSHPSSLESEIIVDVNLNCTEVLPDNLTPTTMPLETDLDRNRLSRSSSRSSVKSNSKSGLDSLREPLNRFDSCENLDQLEEEIIRSLYSPNEGKIEDNIMKNIDLPPSESFQNSGTTATHMRRVILDQLLTGKSVEDIVPNYPLYQRAQSVPERGSRYKSPTKYTAVLTKMHDDNDNATFNPTGNSTASPSENGLNCPAAVTSSNKNESRVLDENFATISDIDTPKRASSVFLFPEDNVPSGDDSLKPTLEISTTGNQHKNSTLEVRRSSWTPQTIVDSTSSGKNSPFKENSSDKKAGQCDFSSCLRPSKIQNSPFLAKINSRSMSPCNFSTVPPLHTPVNSDSTPKRHNSPPKPPEAIGECDFASCLKPSQVQNSLFTAELSEITSNKSTNSLRGESPLSIRAFSPLAVKYNKLENPSPTAELPEITPNKSTNSLRDRSPLAVKSNKLENPSPTAELSEITPNKSTNSLRDRSPLTVHTCSPFLDKSKESDEIQEYIENPDSSEISIEEASKFDDEPTEPVHKSECSITLQTASIHSNNEDTTGKASLTTENFEMKDQQSPAVVKSNQDENLTSDQRFETVIPPPPPPLPPSSCYPKSTVNTNDNAFTSMNSLIQDKKSTLTPVEATGDARCLTPKTPVMIELELKLQNKNDSERRNSIDKIDDKCSTVEDDEITNAERSEIKLNGSPSYVSNGNQNGSIGILSEPREHNSTLSNDKNDRNLLGTTKVTFSPTTVITDDSPPPGAVLLDKKITIDGDKVHTDKYFAIPVKEVLKEKTSTTKFIPAPPKYEGIGPTEEGIPTGLRNSVKKENMHNWYKTMFKSLHKADSSNDSQEYIIGYTSEPESSKRDMMLRKKSSTLDNRIKHDVNSNIKQNYPVSAKSSIEVYNVRPRLIEDFEPGYSSVTDDVVNTSRRYLPSKNTVKPSYEFKNGYESDSTITKKRDQPDSLSADQQKMWYREIQKGGDVPQFGLGKPAPEKPREPSIGPVPPPPLNYNGQPSCQQAVRPLTLPANYSNQNGNGYCQQMNGTFEMQMRQAIHSEMQHRMSPSSNQLSPPIRSIMKSPSRSPDLKIPAQALFDFKAESPKEIPLKKGDSVLILRQLDKNWYEGEHKGVVGIFPISYVEIIPPEHASTPVKVRTEGLGRALYDFVAQTSIELTVRKGDTITLLRRVDANWFEGIFNSKKGIVPISYIQVLQEPIDKNISSPSQKSYSVSPSSFESREKISKPSSLSPSAYSSSSVSPQPAKQERRRLASKKSSNLIEPVLYRALYSYSPQNSDELELQEGDNVYVVEMCDDGWFVGTSVRSGVFGIFPGNYVDKSC